VRSWGSETALRKLGPQHLRSPRGVGRLRRRRRRAPAEEIVSAFPYRSLSIVLCALLRLSRGLVCRGLMLHQVVEVCCGSQYEVSEPSRLRLLDAQQLTKCCAAADRQSVPQAVVRLWNDPGSNSPGSLANNHEWRPLRRMRFILRTLLDQLLHRDPERLRSPGLRVRLQFSERSRGELYRRV
jgi:hypothetical protein